jgi:hypothetical protein
MRKTVCCGAMIFSLLGAGPAFAQATAEPSPAESQRQSFPARPQAPAQNSTRDHNVPPPPLAQPQAPLADQAKPAAVGPAQANTADATDSNVPIGSTGQTMPSTISKDNAALDKLPTIALQFPLTEAQRKLIVSSVATAPKTQASASLNDVHVAMSLPTGIAAQEFSSQVTQEIPDAGRYKYINLADRVLIIDPPNHTVVGEINR